MKKFAAYVRSVMKTKLFLLNVLAEEPTPNNEPKADPPAGEPTPEPKPEPKSEPKPSGNVNFEELIARARKEEKDKLYPEIKKLKEDKNNLLLVVADRDKKIEELTGQLDKVTSDFKKTAKDLETGNASNQKVSELTATISTLERQLEDLQVKYDSDVNSLKLDSYKREKIAAAGGNLIAELVAGSTQEEIDASIETAKARYQEIANKALGGIQMPTANPSSSNVQLKEKTLEEIQSMSSTEYAAWRATAGLR
jgi:hypothetical protein